MMAVTSHRPLAQCAPEIARNQLNARKSWQGAFEKIIYYGPVEPELAGENVEFILCDTKPTIADLCRKCSGCEGWSCIINSDIVLGPHWRLVEPELRKHRVLCAMSRRYELPVNGSFEQAKLVDLGMDWFAATPQIWRAAAAQVPGDFQIGKILWDTWMLSFFMHQSRGNCADVTPGRVIFHPKHGHRSEQHMPGRSNPYLDRVMWPGFQIGKDWTLKERPPHVLLNGGGGGGMMQV